MIRRMPPVPAMTLCVALLLLTTTCQRNGGEVVDKSASPTGDAAEAERAPRCPDPVIPPGVYVANIRKADVREAFQAAANPDLEIPDRFGNPELLDFIPGRWTWYAGVADPNCFVTAWFTLEQEGEVAFVDAHPHTILPDGTIVLHGATEPPSRYSVALSHGALTFELVGADFLARFVVHTAAPWVRKSGP